MREERGRMWEGREGRNGTGEMRMEKMKNDSEIIIGKSTLYRYNKDKIIITLSFIQCIIRHM